MVYARLESPRHRLRSSITEGIVVFLSLFDENPAVHRAFCPPAKRLRRHVKPGTPAAAAARGTARIRPRARAELPGGHEPGLARALGVMLKLDFQRAVLQRIPRSRRNRSVAGAISCSSATSTTRSRPSAKPTRPATSAPSRCRARRADSDRRDAERQLAAIGAAGRRELADVAAVLPDQVVPRDQRRVHGASRRPNCADGATGSRRTTPSRKAGQGAHISLLTGRATATKHP